MSYRYYIGLQLPPELGAEVSSAQAELFDAQTVVEPLEPHITLLPPPAVASVAPEEIAGQLAAAASEFWPLSIRLDGLLEFGNHAIAIGAEAAALQALRTALLAQLPQKWTDTHPFRPHVTLAEAARGTQLPPSLLERYRQHLEPTLPATFTATRLTLFRWLAPRQYSAEQL